VNTARIAELLAPFLTKELSSSQLTHISTYIDLLLRWNARTNLTAIRDPESIVTRHFGESLFAAQTLYPLLGGSGTSALAERTSGVPSLNDGNRAAQIPETTAISTHSNPSLDRAAGSSARPAEPLDLLDIGSGAGFPGLPIKLWAPQLRTTLLESQNKKVVFLREAIRSLTLTDINVSAERAEAFTAEAQLVTLRAVERFDTILPTAAKRVLPQGRIAILIGKRQVPQAQTLAPDLHWTAPIAIPQSVARVLLIGDRQ